MARKEKLFKLVRGEKVEFSKEEYRAYDEMQKSIKEPGKEAVQQKASNSGIGSAAKASSKIKK